MSFAQLPIDFVINAATILFGSASTLVLYRDPFCPQQQQPPPGPTVLRVLDHGGRAIPEGIWTVAAFGNQHLEWRAFKVTYEGDVHSQRQAQPGGAELFAAFLEQTTIEIELCLNGHAPAQCPVGCTQRDNLILQLGMSPA